MKLLRGSRMKHNLSPSTRLFTHIHWRTIFSICFGIFIILVFTDTSWARRKVLGRITYEIDGSPVEGARIRAWDSDFANPDDFMGRAYTDANGNYVINYAGGHWDPAPHRITTWRPDIYIHVAIQSNNRWIRVRTSDTHSNQRLRRDLTINLAIRGGAIVFGTITNRSDGRPVSGVNVSAYDSDSLSRDDLLGVAVTNSLGEYRIEYARKHWDPAPHASGLWRPDIYIRVSKDGYIIDDPKSSTHSNHRLREDLQIDKQISIYPETLMIEGTILYEEADANVNNNDSIGYKPVRYCSVTLSRQRSDEKYHRVTDFDGIFRFVIRRSPGATYKIVIRPKNHAVRVYKDLTWCNEEVWWRKTFVIPATNNLNLGELRIGINSNHNVEGFWQEVEGNFIHDIFCGGPRRDLQGGSAYFNIAETIRLTKEYAHANRDDDDSIGRVSVAYPSSYIISGQTWTNPFFGEIYLTKKTDNRDTGFLDYVIIHEYAHHLAEEISENDWAVETHERCSVTDEEMAWFEGFAEYLGNFLMNRFNNDPDSYLSQIREMYDFAEEPDCASFNKTVEGIILAVLWDLVDEPGSEYPNSISESHDVISNRDQVIFKIFDKELDNFVDAPDICEFVEAWNNRFSSNLVEALNKILAKYNINCE